MSRLDSLASWARVSPPATEEQIRAVEARFGFRFSDEYRNFLLVTNGMLAHDFVLLFSVDDILERNETNEISTYFPGWVMIGDDSGGRGILVPTNASEGPVYWVDMGSALIEESDRLSDRLTSWLEDRCPIPE